MEKEEYFSSSETLLFCMLHSALFSFTYSAYSTLLLKWQNSEKNLVQEKLYEFCLQKGPSFGKSQLLHGAKLANQNKDIMAPNFKLHVAVRPKSSFQLPRGRWFESPTRRLGWDAWHCKNPVLYILTNVSYQVVNMINRKKNCFPINFTLSLLRYFTIYFSLHFSLLRPTGLQCIFRAS